MVWPSKEAGLRSKVVIGTSGGTSEGDSIVGTGVPPSGPSARQAIIITSSRLPINKDNRTKGRNRRIIVYVDYQKPGFLEKPGFSTPLLDFE
jgi:hypothetical protein